MPQLIDYETLRAFVKATYKNFDSNSFAILHITFGNTDPEYCPATIGTIEVRYNSLGHQSLIGIDKDGAFDVWQD